MRHTILAAAAAFVFGGIATGAVLTQAQPAPPPAPLADAPPPAPPGHWMGWGQHRHTGPMAGPMAGPMMGHGWARRHGDHGMPFALVYRQKDRNLSPADVQKIAEAFLLWNGNHTWKVANVAATPDGAIGFSLTTPEGGLIAKFTMDPHTGRIHRVG